TLRRGTPASVRAGAGDGRAQTLSSCAARSLGAGDAGAVLRPGCARRGAQYRRARAIRDCVGRCVLSHGACGSGGGSMKRNELFAATEHPEPVLDFVRRARDRLTTVAPASISAANELPPTGEHEW